MNHVIISGGLGHIGSKLIRVLLKNGFKVTCLDNFATQRISSLKGLIGIKNFTFHETNLANSSSDILKLIGTSDYSSFIHLAAITNAEASYEDPKKLFDNNLLATKSALEISSKLNLKLIFPSSTSIYGSAKEDVHEDDDSFINPQSPYAECKVEEEILIKKEGLEDSIILRLGTIFGTSPGMRFHTAVNKFCWQASLNQPISVWKTAMHQYRPYLDLNDACKAFIFFLKRQQTNSSTFNVNTANYTVSEILNSIKLNKPDIKIKFVNSKIMNQLSYLVLNKKIKALGFSFEGNLDAGITNTFKWIEGKNN